jgi:hypothetical protein
MIDYANLSATHGMKKPPSAEGGKKPTDAIQYKILAHAIIL